MLEGLRHCAGACDIQMRFQHGIDFIPIVQNRFDICRAAVRESQQEHPFGRSRLLVLVKRQFLKKLIQNIINGTGCDIFALCLRRYGGIHHTAADDKLAAASRPRTVLQEQLLFLLRSDSIFQFLRIELPFFLRGFLT